MCGRHGEARDRGGPIPWDPTLYGGRRGKSQDLRLLPGTGSLRVLQRVDREAKVDP